MKKVIASIALMLFIVGCAGIPEPNQTSGHIGNVSLGMTKQQVISTMGQPYSVSAHNRTEYMMYKLCTAEGNLYDLRCRRWEEYFVRLSSGRVDSYGKKGDFDSTKVPETTQNINITRK